MGENTLALVRYLFPFVPAVRENFAYHNNIVLPGIYLQNCRQEIQRQGQTLSSGWNMTFHYQSVNHNFQQQTNRIP
jgi:hypothetical protein